nr:LEF-2 [Pieris rapae granulovirus]
MDYEIYHPRIPIDTSKTYKVDKFLRRWNDVGPNSAFLPGGRYFIISGKFLPMLVQKSPNFEEEEETEIIMNKNKKNVCFLPFMHDRQMIIEKYKKLFYSGVNARKSEEAFKNLCIRVRLKRYSNRLSFNYLIVKQLQCSECKNKCVYNALKKFYNMESKCVAQLDDLLSRET